MATWTSRESPKIGYVSLARSHSASGTEKLSLILCRVTLQADGRRYIVHRRRVARGMLVCVSRSAMEAGDEPPLPGFAGYPGWAVRLGGGEAPLSPATPALPPGHKAGPPLRAGPDRSWPG